MEELVIRDADVVDGSGEPSYRADVVVDGGRIVSIVKEAAAAGCQRPRARRELDAEGLVLSPGFIDMHAHSDLAVLRDPDHSAKAAQGVTLEVLGQDGLSYAPVDDRTLAEVRRAITGWNGYGDDIDFDWRSVGEYLDRLDHGFDGQGIAVNAAYLIPQGTVRMLAVGWEDREATPQELDRMRQLVAEGMEQGAVGMSSGLTYTPGMYAKDAELTELCRVVAEYDGYGEALAEVSVRLQASTSRASVGPAQRPGDYRARAALARQAADLRVLEQAAEIRSQRLHAPFLDNQVVRACRTLPEALRVQPGARAAILRRVLEGAGVSDLPPGWGAPSHASAAVAARTGLRVAADSLMALFGTPLLAEAGLVEARVVRKALRAAAAGEPLPLDGLADLVSLELWLRRLLSRRGTCWTGTPARQRAVPAGITPRRGALASGGGAGIA